MHIIKKVAPGWQWCTNYTARSRAIYGLHTIDDRKTLWTDLKDPNNLQQGPWVLIMLYYMQMKE